MASRNEPKSKLEQGTDPIELPGVFGILPLRNSVLFPQTVMPISVGREKTLRLIDDAIKDSKPIAVVSQKDPATDDPEPDAMYRFGTAARILKAIRIGGNNVNLIIQGVSRVRVVRWVGTAPFLTLGDPDTFAAFADNIVGTHAQGALDAPDTYDRYPVQLRLRVSAAWQTVTLSPAALRVALAAYMTRIPVEPSPFAPPGRRAVTAAERRGLTVFRADCAGCHQLRTGTTASRAVGPDTLESRLLAGDLVLTSARRYDVGTPVIGEGGNNPPSLRGAWAAAPYFSDGSAATLEEALRRTDPSADRVHAPDNATRPTVLSPAQRADLAAFLRAL